MQLRHHFARACRLDPNELAHINSMWTRLVGPATGAIPTEVETEEKTETEEPTSD